MTNKKQEMLRNWPALGRVDPRWVGLNVPVSEIATPTVSGPLLWPITPHPVRAKPLEVVSRKPRDVTEYGAYSTVPLPTKAQMRSLPSQWTGSKGCPK